MTFLALDSVLLLEAKWMPFLEGRSFKLGDRGLEREKETEKRERKRKKRGKKKRKGDLGEKEGAVAIFLWEKGRSLPFFGDLGNEP